MAGFMAEMIACLYFVPVDIIKERLMVQSDIKLYTYKNSYDAVK